MSTSSSLETCLDTLFHTHQKPKNKIKNKSNQLIFLLQIFFCM